MKKILMQISVVLVTVMLAGVAFAAGKGSIVAKLSGGESVPSVTTKAKGEAVFHKEKDGKELTYKLTVTDLANVTAAHIHMGKKGESGPPVAGLFAGPKKSGSFSGVLAEGTLTDKDLIGPMSGKTIKDLVKLIKDGEAYVNVHSEKYPGGELRGQIKKDKEYKK